MTNFGKTLSVHLGGELKRRWVVYCNQAKTTPSAIVRGMILHILSKGSSHIGAAAVEVERSDTTRRRCEVRLTTSEYRTICKHAEWSGMSVNQWVANLVRSKITGQPQFGMHELSMLGESNTKLLSVGRNLNQIARQMNASGRAKILTTELIEEIRELVLNHTREVSSLIRSNIDRWEVR